MIPCPNRCSVKLTRRDLPDHLQHDCPKRKVKCEFCGSEFTGEAYEVWTVIPPDVNKWDLCEDLTSYCRLPHDKAQNDYFYNNTDYHNNNNNNKILSLISLSFSDLYCWRQWLWYTVNVPLKYDLQLPSRCGCNNATTQNILPFVSSVPEPPGRVSSGERVLWEQVRGEDDASPAAPAQHGWVSQTHPALQVLRQGVCLWHNPGQSWEKKNIK